MDPESFEPHDGGEQTPIPEELYSEYEERPFQTCTRCGESLEHFEDGYKISKVLKNGEVIFEYALCFPCLERMMEESSEESQQRLMQFQMERMRDVTGTQECALCDRMRVDLDPPEFALVAGCQGQGLLESHLVCIHCMEEMSSLVSEQTRNEWNRFVEENFPGVPADFAPVPGEPLPSPMMV